MRNLPIRRVETPTSKYSIKCPYDMVPEEIATHNTANDAPAMNEISYMLNNNNMTSYHFAVDDVEAVQGLPLNRNGFHAGDGANGRGNRKSIGVEICYSKSGGDKFTKAEQNGATLIAMLLKQYGWGIEKVKKHQDYSGKYCPHRTLDMGWDRFLNMIRAELGEAPVTPPVEPVEPPKPSGGMKYGVGTKFTCTGLWTQANGGTWYPASGLSTGKGDYEVGSKVYYGADHPYQAIKNGTVIGFANDKCIDDEPSVPGGTAKPTPPVVTPPTSSTKYGVGTKCTYTGLWSSSNGGTWYPKSSLAIREGTVTKVIAGAEHPYLINDGVGWANDKCIDDEPSVPGGASTSNPTPSAPKPSSTKYGVGTKVCTNTLATSSTGGKVYKGDWKGTITRVIPGTAYPYLIDNGTGWTNDTGIDTDPHSPY